MLIGLAFNSVRLRSSHSVCVVQIFRNFKEAAAVRTGFSAEAIHGGTLLGVRTADYIVFYDWATAKVHDNWLSNMLLKLQQANSQMDFDQPGLVLSYCLIKQSTMLVEPLSED